MTPTQDRAAFHLLGHPLPALIDLPSTSSTTIDLFTLSLRSPIMLFLHPRLTSPLSPTPSTWSSIPNTSGCTPHLTSVNSVLPQLLAKEPELKIFGLSTQPPTEQLEAKQRLGLHFDLLSDETGQLREALDIPSFEVDGKQYLKRMTLLLRGGQVTRVDYPVKPEEAAKRAVGLLRSEQELMEEVEARDAAAAAAAKGAQTQTQA